MQNFLGVEEGEIQVGVEINGGEIGVKRGLTCLNELKSWFKGSKFEVKRGQS